MSPHLSLPDGRNLPMTLTSLRAHLLSPINPRSIVGVSETGLSIDDASLTERFYGIFDSGYFCYGAKHSCGILSAIQN
jgi:hypothetical protein